MTTEGPTIDPAPPEGADALLATLWARSNRGFVLLDEACRIRAANAHFTTIAGTPLAELVGRVLFEAVPLATHLEGVIRRVIATGEPVLDLDLVFDWGDAAIDLLPVDRGALLVMTPPRPGAGGAQTAIAMTRQVFLELSARLARTSARDATASIEEALRAVGETFALERAFVRLLSEDEASFVLRYEYHRPGLAPVAPREVPVRVWAWAHERFVAGEAVVLSSLDDVPERASSFRASLEGMGVSSSVGVPVLDGSKLLGYVAYVRADVGAWSDATVSRLRFAGEMIAGVVARCRAEEAIRDRLAFEELLTDATARFVDLAPADVDAEILRTLATIGGERRLDRVMVLQLDAASTTLTMTHEWCASSVPSVRALFSTRPVDALHPIVRRVVLDGAAVVGREEDAAPGSEVAELLHRMGVHGFAMVPLRVGGGVKGALALHVLTHTQGDPALVVPRVRLVADVVAHALARRKATERAFEEVSRQKRSAERERDYLREERDDAVPFVVGESQAMRRAIELVEAVADTDASVLLLGESGVGKECFARLVHARSRRASGPLVKVNCASVSTTLFESEFFGHAKGSFTGAHKDRAGRFELADGGTLFLDEVGEIPIELQAKLLRVLQEGELERVGEDRTRRLDVRIVAATNRDLEREIAEGRFRSDLYFRLGVFPIRVPLLRERLADVVPLARHFLARHASRMHRSGITLTPEDEARLVAYDWPGNVRELDHVIERAVILSRAGALRLDLALPQAPQGGVSRAPLTEILSDEDLRRVERENIELALTKAGGRISGQGGAAELLGMKASTVRDRMKALHIVR